MNKKHKILFFSMIFVVGGLKAQTLVDSTALPALYRSPFKCPNPQVFTTTKRFANSMPVHFRLAPNYAATQLGFFCKQELKLDKITKVPLRFRLGSVAQCDWLEGKRK